jgi:S1-C subfamily serine protease
MGTLLPKSKGGRLLDGIGLLEAAMERQRDMKAAAGMVALAAVVSVPAGLWAQSVGIRDVAAMPAAATVAMQTQLAEPQRDGGMVLAYPVNEYPGETRGGYLGVGVQDVSDDRVAALKLKDAGGVEVVALDHDGPAAKAGIHEHDVILQMNGQSVAGAEQLRRMLRETPAGRKADFVLSRDGQEVKVELVLGDRTMSEQAVIPPMPPMNIKLPEMQNFVPAMDIELTGMNSSDMGPMVIMGRGISGAVVESLGPQLAQYFGAKDGVGVLVKEVRQDSPAGKAGMRAGDVIVSAAGQQVSGRSVWERVLWGNRGKTVAVQVLREKRTVTISLHVPEKTDGQLVPQSFVINEDELPQMAQLSAEEEAKIKQAMEQAQKEMESSRAETEKAMAELKEQMNSPEFKQQMEDAQREAVEAQAQINSEETKQAMERAKAAVEQAKIEMDSPEFKKQMEDAQREAVEAQAQKEMESSRAETEKAMAELKEQMNSPEFKQQMEEMRPEIEKQMKEAQEQMKKAQEEMQRELVPMD